jgi:hypothetical protein
MCTSNHLNIVSKVVLLIIIIIWLCKTVATVVFRGDAGGEIAR